MSTKYIIDNVSEQSITGDLTINGNLVITGTTNTRHYKVFTALLTQSGGANNDTTTGAGGTLDIGYTYLIIDNPDNYDLTLYGAPNNLPGTYFICNNPVYVLPYTSSLQIEVNYGAPVATVLENTIGNVWFIYGEPGYYSINSNSLFSSNKTYFQKVVMTSGTILNNNINSSSSIEISPTDGDTMLLNTPIEIKVYN